MKVVFNKLKFNHLKFFSKNTIKTLLYNIFPIFLIAVAVFIVDQITKKIVFVHFILTNKPIIILPILKIQMIFNYGVSFSFLTGASPLLILVLSLVALTLVITLLVFMFNVRRLIVKIAIGIIIGAALGNMYDRVELGAVIDFIYFHYNGYYFPIFNGADTFITCATLLLIVELLIQKRKR